MAGLLVRLKQHKDGASPAERDLIGRILDDPEVISGLSIHELAAHTFASPSTITRMCKKLGLKGYKEFQRLLIYDLALLRESELSKIEDLAPTDTTLQTIEKVTRGNVDSLRLVSKLNEPEVYDTCVDLMEAARTINLFAALRPRPALQAFEDWGELQSD